MFDPDPNLPLPVQDALLLPADRAILPSDREVIRLAHPHPLSPFGDVQDRDLYITDLQKGFQMRDLRRNSCILRRSRLVTVVLMLDTSASTGET
jgi:hypothetical protein